MGDGPPQSEGHALLKAVFQGKLRLTRLLLEGGAYINEGNERGETPLAAACLASYADPLTRQRLVRYLLEKGADPNIPDKSGRTALMHACAGRAGQEVVALLLGNGADPSLKDYSGSSALVHAIDRGDRDALAALLDACKAKGQEVIIITTDTAACGAKNTKQYLNAPPSPRPPPAPGCTSPSEVEVTAPPSPSEEGGVFSLALAAARPPGEKRPPPRQLLKRLNSEPWGLVAPSVLAGAQMSGLSIAERARPRLSRRHSIETHDPRAPGPRDHGAPSGSSWADKVQQHQILYRRNTAPESQESAAPRAPAHPKPTRTEPSGSEAPRDPGCIPGSPDSGRVSAERRRFDASPLAGSSRESLENLPGSLSPGGVRRRAPGLLERRGSGTLLLDHISHTRPGFLPPLNINPQRPIPDIRANGKPPSPAHRARRGPVAPASPKRGPDFKTKKKLMRRHSMQTEQMKQLSTFQVAEAPRD
ncbi:ankyrin repeat domain-containing protein 34A [Pseudoliparis swirei]|uniref:ankyrin repeat domain-containing protein 34A n=1 Tax=Pseudoliparis swirei TaxID=2059687 RepID=UPI0024BD6DD3|nr:ankyrin repeat domain-containing protein 34A [Pseudoliparis swirei]